jgi:hypothetical protein
MLAICKEVAYLVELRDLLPGVRARFGAIERGFYLSAIAWFAVFASACAASIR